MSSNKLSRTAWRIAAVSAASALAMSALLINTGTALAAGPSSPTTEPDLNPQTCQQLPPNDRSHQCQQEIVRFYLVNQATGLAGTATVTVTHSAVLDPYSRTWTDTARTSIDSLTGPLMVGATMQVGAYCSVGCSDGNLSNKQPILMGEHFITRSTVVSDPNSAASPGRVTSTQGVMVRVNYEPANPNFADDYTRDLPTVRCDNENRTGKNTRVDGCVFPGVIPTIEFSGKKFPYIAYNILAAQRSGLSALLQRATDARAAQNRQVTCLPNWPRPGGSRVSQCDEYPFASSVQGGVSARNMTVPAGENSCQGYYILSQYRTLHLLKPSANQQGPSDAYLIAPTDPASMISKPYDGKGPVTPSSPDENLDTDDTNSTPPC